MVAILLGVAGYFVLRQRTSSPVSIPSPTSIVGGEKIVKRECETVNSFLIKRINVDSVEGIWPPSGEIPPIYTGGPRTLHIGSEIGATCGGISIKLTSIDYFHQTVTFTTAMVKTPCPEGLRAICLASSALISTPLGLVPVKDMRVGMPIWTADKAGHRVTGIVTRTSKVSVPPTHQMVRLLLDDGRELLVSPGHPTIDGRTVGDLVVGNLYNGVRIVASERVAYRDVATYDILPSGETGFYWANSILLDSTLH